ncbi:hypothetical protein [Microbacterium deminutum]|uniref:Uncharacterized protein n=1 Tax=Microbacterium deminutum TaxID=344164 RepID=A0ABN2QFD7_9MICO
MRRVAIDPFTAAVRQGHVNQLRRLAGAFPTDGLHQMIAKAQAGAQIILDTSSVCVACVRAGLDHDAGRFTIRADRDNARNWLLPAHDLGRMIEVEQRAGTWCLVGTDMPV